MIQLLATDECFGASRHLGFFGATIIDVMVRLAVFLMFEFFLSGYAHTAGAALEQSAKRQRVILYLVPLITAIVHDFLHPVEEGF